MQRCHRCTPVHVHLQLTYQTEEQDWSEQEEEVTLES